MAPYLPPWWLPGGHAQTIVPARLLPVPDPAYARVRWETPDGDFLDIDFALAEPAPPAHADVLVLFHGLEGSSASHYARVLMDAARRRGWRALVVHFRGCSGEANRMPRAYHSGDSDEIEWVLRRVARAWPEARRHAVGVSLGGNALAKWAGERGAAAGICTSLATVSAPFDLAAGGAALGRPGNRIYTAMFLRSLRRKALAMIDRYPGLADARRVAACRSLYEFDDAFTAPVHGFAGVRDYWQRAAAKPWLRGITVPTLALNARNDPFVPSDSLPGPHEVSRALVLETPEGGGHVGFYRVAGRAGARGGSWYFSERVLDFLEHANAPLP